MYCDICLIGIIWFVVICNILHLIWSFTSAFICYVLTYGMVDSMVHVSIHAKSFVQLIHNSSWAWMKVCILPLSRPIDLHTEENRKIKLSINQADSYGIFSYKEGFRLATSCAVALILLTKPSLIDWTFCDMFYNRLKRFVVAAQLSVQLTIGVGACERRAYKKVSSHWFLMLDWWSNKFTVNNNFTLGSRNFELIHFDRCY